MATITIQVNKGGSALEGATLIAGDITPTGLTTNASGSITKTVDEDFKVFVAVSILHNDIPSGRRDFGIHLLEAGQSYTFAV